MTLNDLPSLLTLDEAAALLRTSREVVRAMAERAQHPGVTRIGRRLLIRSVDLLHRLDQKARFLESAIRLPDGAAETCGGIVEAPGTRG